MNWNGTDYAVAGVLVLVTLVAVWLAGKRVSGNYRWVAIGGILVVFLLVWAELAVGIFGTPFAGN